MTDPKYEQIARGNEDLRNGMEGNLNEPQARSVEEEHKCNCKNDKCTNCNCNKEGK